MKTFLRCLVWFCFTFLYIVVRDLLNIKVSDPYGDLAVRLFIALPFAVASYFLQKLIKNRFENRAIEKNVSRNKSDVESIVSPIQCDAHGFVECPLCHNKQKIGLQRCTGCNTRLMIKPIPASTEEQQLQHLEAGLSPAAFKVTPKTRFCRKCGFELLDSSKSCSHCGTEIIEVKQS